MLLVPFVFFVAIRQLQACLAGLFELPPPVIHYECLQKGAMSCGMGYFCGPYGCTRRRRTFGVATFEAGVGQHKLRTGDAHFLRCCEANLLPDECIRSCTFETYTAAFILAPRSCPVSALSTMHWCSSRQMDHSLCCSQKGVPHECLQFCAPTNSRVSLQPRHFRCFQHFHQLKECFQRTFDDEGTATKVFSPLIV